MNRNVVSAGLACMLLGSIASAATWADKLFSDSNYNFGTVARDAKTEHEFVIKNTLRQDIHIAGVRASCGCTTPIVTKETLKPGETGSIIAHFNTDRFSGQHGATLTVVFDRPQPTEVQLRVDGFVRTDVAISPGSVQFGSVDQGQPAERTVRINFTGNQKVMSVKSSSDAIIAKMVSARESGYTLSVRLNDSAPAGYINEQVTVITNDGTATRIPVKVEGRIVPPLTVSPSTLALGALHPGQEVTKNLVVQGKKPFRILDIVCDDGNFHFDIPQKASKMHIVPVTFQAGTEPGKISQKLRIQTDLSGEIVVEVTASANVQVAVGE